MRGTVGSGTIALSVYAPKRPPREPDGSHQAFENGSSFSALATGEALRADRATDFGWFGLPVGPERDWIPRQCQAACALWAQEVSSERKPLNTLEDFHHVTRYLSEITSARINRDHVLIYASTDAAVAAVLGTCARGGDRIAMPTLMAPNFLRIANSLNLDIVGLHSDEHGLLPESFELACWSRPIRALLVQPDGQFGTGAVMPTRRRQQVAEIARRFDVLVLEDGTPGALRERTAPSLFSFNAQHVVHLTGLSGALSRFLNASLLVFGEGSTLFGPLAASAMIDRPNFIDSFLAAECFGGGLHRELASWHKREAHQRAAIAAAAFGASLQGNAGGYQCAVKLPMGWAGDLATTRIRKTGLSIGLPSDYTLDGAASGPLGRDRSQLLVLGLGATGSIAALQRDLSMIVDVLGGPQRPLPAKPSSTQPPSRSVKS